MTKQRNHNIDFIKAMASFFVTAVHFRNRVEPLISEEFYTGAIKLFFTLNYSLFIIAVPLFLLSTGYLNIHVKLNKKYLLGILKVYLLYCFIALISYPLMVSFGVRENIGLLRMIKRTLSFSLISGWYIEMFIGLALFIPFINILIENMNRHEFKILLFMLVITIGLPAWLNSQPYTAKFIYLPNYWKSVYPIIYYFIGAYIRKYEKSIKVNYTKLIALSSFVLIFLSVYFNQSYKSVGTDGYYSSILEITLASTIFYEILNYSIKENRIIQFISRHTLSTYISAYPVDYVVYPFIMTLIGGPINSLYISPIIVIVAFTISLLWGAILQNIFNFLAKYIEIMINWPTKNMIKHS